MAFKLAEAFVQLDLQGGAGVRAALGGVGADVRRLGGQLGGLSPALGGVTGRFAGMASGLSVLLTPLGAAVAGIGALTAAVGGMGAAIGSAAVAGVKLAAASQSARAAFTTMLGSANEADKMVDSLKRFAAETPFEFPELREAATLMVAFGFSTDEIIPKLRQLGDLSAALRVPLGELAVIYGKARVQGRLYMEDINQLTERRIPIIGALADALGVAESEIRGMVTAGQIGFPELEEALARLTDEGSKFGGGMERLSQELEGLYSTLKDNVNQALEEFGQILIDEFDLKGLLVDLVDLTGEFRDEFVPALRTVIEVGHEFADLLLEYDSMIGGPISKLKMLAGVFTELQLAVLKAALALAKLKGDDILADELQKGIDEVSGVADAKRQRQRDKERKERQDERRREQEERRKAFEERQRQRAGGGKDPGKDHPTNVNREENKKEREAMRQRVEEAARERQKGAEEHRRRQAEAGDAAQELADKLQENEDRLREKRLDAYDEVIRLENAALDRDRSRTGNFSDPASFWKEFQQKIFRPDDMEKQQLAEAKRRLAALTKIEENTRKNAAVFN